MTAEQRELVCARLEASFLAISAATEALSASQWGFRLSPDAWSAAQCVEHVTEVEQNVNRRIHALLQAGFNDPALCAEAAGKERLLLRAVPNRTRQAQAPSPPANGPDFALPQAGLAQLHAIRAQTLEYARTTQDEVEQYIHPHFVFGPMNIYQWLLMLSLHCERHTAQIEELKANPEFPKA